MNDRELMGLLRANRRLEIAEIQQWLDRERKDCLKVTRVYDIALDPAAATGQEQAQMAKRAHCVRMVEVTKASLARGATVTAALSPGGEGDIAGGF